MIEDGEKDDRQRRQKGMCGGEGTRKKGGGRSHGEGRNRCAKLFRKRGLKATGGRNAQGIMWKEDGWRTVERSRKSKPREVKRGSTIEYRAVWTHTTQEGVSGKGKN